MSEVPIMDDIKALREKIAKLAASGTSKRAVASLLGIHYSKVDKHWIGSPEPVALDPIETARARADDEAKRREYVTSVKELAFRDFLEDLVTKQVKPLPPGKPPQATKNKKGHKRSAYLGLTDWHFEERVNAEAVLGLNSYGIETACKRVYRVVQAACDWRRDMEAGGKFVLSDLTVGLMGDFLTGTLHGLERHTDAPNVVRAAIACGDLIALALRDLAAEFRSVKVVGVVGNHGRLPDDRKVPTKDPTRSWDYLAYQIARRRLEGTPNIEFFLPESYGCLFEVGGHLCYTSHGNFIPNNLGVVGYGVRRFASALASNLNAAGKQLRYCFFGHWHQANSSEFAGMQCFICPSLIGTQEYGFLQGGSVNRPAQSLFLFDEDFGLTSVETLYGDGGKNDRYTGTYEIEV